VEALCQTQPTNRSVKTPQATLKPWKSRLIHRASPTRKSSSTFGNSYDPTTLNRQGADIGEQYRSAIFYLNESQREIALQSKSAAQQAFESPIVTSIEPAGTFWPAESWHQDYYAHNPDAPYCRFVIAPKVAKWA